MINYIPNGFQIGEKYIFRVKAMTNETDSPSGAYESDTEAFTIEVLNIEDDTIQYFDVGTPEYSDEWLEYPMICKRSCARTNIANEKVVFSLKANDTYWLEEVQFFPYREAKDKSGNIKRINPGELDSLSVATTYYKYYNNTKNGAIYDISSLPYLYNSTTDWDYKNLLEEEYNTNFEKIRSISIKQSNRFNILQTIAETFECWIRFEIQHDQSTGRTIYFDGVPQKMVYIVKEIGQETGIGFVYGIDLKSISRTIQSDQIVTKTIVEKNNNQFATNGFCTIARASENYPRESFILNFDYYINQGLLDGTTINNDLYLSGSNEWLGYYPKLRELNSKYDQQAELLTARRNELIKMESFQKTYSNSCSALIGEKQNLENELINLAGASSLDGIKNYIEQNPSNETVAKKMNAWQAVCKTLEYYSAELEKLETSIGKIAEEIEYYENADTNQNSQKNLKKQINELHLKFYKKYSRFIQEGSWKSEDYIDDNLYYLDAVSVAYTSSRPQISYNISVMRISSIEGFENKVFHLGDISYVQDTEFFGYQKNKNIDNIKTPYREKVLVAEITSNFDSPELDTFKVQNYKTQFEDLFQRITSTTQSLQYASGQYAKAANIIEEDGTIKVETLQNSIAVNQQLVYSAQNESVVSDSTGITVSNETNPNNKTKIKSGGVFITTDGGQTWKNAIKGGGVSTEYLTSGSIATDKITILDSNRQTFRWDSDGISAFKRRYSDGQDIGIDLSKYVRFNHYGIFGIEDVKSELISEDDIWDNAKFGMTWKGFFVKNKSDSGQVEISSENDIRVTSGTSNTERIKIGRLSGTGAAGDPYIYGIRISDADGSAVMETSDSGALWLRNRLNISSTSGANYNIGIGYLDGTKPETNIHEVFNANNSFLVYEDGSMKATNGDFTGTIIATGGKIGNLTIEEVEQSGYRVVIESNDGTIFKNGVGSKTLTAKLYKGNTQITDNLTYKWSESTSSSIISTDSSIVVQSKGEDKVWTYTCEITVEDDVNE